MLLLSTTRAAAAAAVAAAAEATRRGMGAALLRKPTKLAKMVAGIATAVELPVTVKIRTGARISSILTKATVPTPILCLCDCVVVTLIVLLSH
jgi:tRNA-dihydrouridine synthase